MIVFRDATCWNSVLPVALAGAIDLASDVVRLERLRRPVPVWMLLVGILVTASVATGVFIGPSYLGPKPDFSLQPVQTSGPVFAGAISYRGALVFRIGVTSVNGFSGIVSFSAPAPAGLDVRVQGIGSPNPVAILGRNDTIDVSVGANNVGNYTLTVTGTSGALSHSVTLMVIAQTITFTANPDLIVISKTVP